MEADFTSDAVASITKVTNEVQRIESLSFEYKEAWVGEVTVKAISKISFLWPMMNIATSKGYRDFPESSVRWIMIEKKRWAGKMEV
ncbi:hypothetical protein [Sulfoacidibacillus ferrooxidans]|uniref:Uncharacterized protein n=1 Tax=Sulfoacidibacillus ferrooxidans TaxID=2005001 RepID=A0A9X1VAX7_9BACL|nr:hypothetical protein [Sulfoacidibacillus ferrooxidans]MCI0184484.1 hypothetical protein [Sulfoacidibacillus ferrooxidans]